MSDQSRKARMDRFNALLPSRYREFKEFMVPNPGLVHDLKKRWWTICGEKVWGSDQQIGNKTQSGFLFYGAPRGGKTIAACELARQLILNPECNADAKFIAMVEWAAECSTRARQCRLEDWSESILRPIWNREESVLILDDLDKIRATDSVQSQLFNLIETATANEVALIATTNADANTLIEKFEETLGMAIVARLRDFCVPVCFDVKLPVASEAVA